MRQKATSPDESPDTSVSMGAGCQRAHAVVVAVQRAVERAGRACRAASASPAAAPGSPVRRRTQFSMTDVVSLQSHQAHYRLRS